MLMKPKDYTEILKLIGASVIVLIIFYFIDQILTAIFL